MSKTKKKRNKRYQGAGAKQTSPQVIRVAAVKRSKTGQWWHEKKSAILRVGGIAGGAILFIVIIVELIRLFIN
ncbi:MAG: hypothetical protein ACTJG2_02535 [Candidatus Saccharimonadales bacterium]